MWNEKKRGEWDGGEAGGSCVVGPRAQTPLVVESVIFQRCVYRTKLLYTGTRRFQFDGLNSLQYRLVHVADTPLYTHVLVDIGKPPRGF